jgi:hypothetical protein
MNNEFDRMSCVQIVCNYKKKRHFKIIVSVSFFRSDFGGTRTLDPLIKSQLLYQLSYETLLAICNPFLYCGCKSLKKSQSMKIKQLFF